MILPHRLLNDGTLEELHVPQNATASLIDIHDQRQVVGKAFLWDRQGSSQGGCGAIWTADEKLVDLNRRAGRAWLSIHRGMAISFTGVIAAMGSLNSERGSRAMPLIPE
jgi:hypothetical protein